MPTALLIIAPEMFRDEEYAEPKQVLESAGFDVTTASVEAGVCTGRFGLGAVADVALRDAVPEHFDVVAFIGGPGARVYFEDPEAQRIARGALEADKVLGAICIAPSILGNAGLLDGVTVSSFPSEETNLLASGAIWTGRPVEVDGRIVTANGPEAAAAFGEALVAVADGETGKTDDVREVTA
jgi:protease I